MKVLAILFAFSLAFNVRAQPVGITIDDQPEHGQIQSWLLSADPRLIAWGAHFAREQNDTPALTLALQVVQRIPASTKPQQNAQLAILDALIERNVAVSSDAVGKIAATFPTQAAILASRLPASDATPLLLKWFATRGSLNEQLLSRVAGMLLSHAPPPGFAAAALNLEEVTLTISVVEPGKGFGSGFGSASCGDSFGTKRDPDWPPVYTYSLSRAETTHGSPVLVEASGESIVYVRHEIHSGWGECSSDWSNYAATIHHILAQMLGMPDGQLQFQTYERTSIEWADDDHFYDEAKQAVADEEAKFYGVAEAFYERQLVTAEEALNSRPKLSVMVEDERNPKGPPLPELHFSDPRTVAVPPPLTFEGQMRKIVDPAPK
jgi:hypothetical protein